MVLLCFVVFAAGGFGGLPDELQLSAGAYFRVVIALFRLVNLVDEVGLLLLEGRWLGILRFRRLSDGRGLRD